MNLEEERALRDHVSRLLITWREARGGAFAGADRDDYAAMIIAADIVADEARTALQLWVDAARRAGMSWAEIGDVLAISKQAAQQRFGRAEPIQRAWDEQDLLIRTGVTAFNEATVLAREGALGHELVGVGWLTLKFRRTECCWEYRRVAAVSVERALAATAGEAWEHASSWFPFHYLKRPTGSMPR